MIKALEQAIEKVRRLSKERQEYAAEVLEQIAQADDEIYHLTDEERRLVDEGLAELDRGEARRRPTFGQSSTNTGNEAHLRPAGAARRGRNPRLCPET